MRLVMSNTLADERCMGIAQQTVRGLGESFLPILNKMRNVKRADAEDHFGWDSVVGGAGVCASLVVMKTEGFEHR